jgi:dTDP-4-dehydrorhamnose reductase
LTSEHAEHARLARVAVDLLAPGEPGVAFDRCAPTHVLLAAAEADGGTCERDPERARRINTEVPGEVARWCAARGARLVHCSTDLVFGAHAPPAGGFDEAHAVGPQGVYGRTKADGEEAVLAACPAALVARLPLLYGDGRGRPKGAGDSLFAGLAAGRRTVLFDDEWRQPAEVREAAEVLLELALGDAAGRVHVACAEPVTRAELGRLALAARAAAGGAPLPEPEVGPRATLGLAETRPARLTLDVSRLRGLLGRVPRSPAEVLGG